MSHIQQYLKIGQISVIKNEFAAPITKSREKFHIDEKIDPNKEKNCYKCYMDI